MVSVRLSASRLCAWSLIAFAVFAALLMRQAGVRGTYAAEFSPERRRELIALAREFSGAAVRIDTERAYALLSDRRRQTMTRARFEEALRANLATFTVWDERPIWVEVADPGLASAWYGVPEEADAAAMEAWVVVTVGKERVPPAGIAPRPCDLYLLVVADEGGLRIGSFNFAWCD